MTVRAPVDTNVGGTVWEPQADAVADVQNPSSSGCISSRLLQDTVSTLAKKRIPGQPEKGIANLISLNPPLPEQQPSTAPLSTYVVIPTGFAVPHPHYPLQGAAPSSGQQGHKLSPRMAADAAKAAYSAALDALGRSSHGSESRGVDDLQNAPHCPEPAGQLEGGASVGSNVRAEPLKGPAGEGDADVRVASRAAAVVRFDLADGMRRGPRDGLQEEAGGRNVTYVKLSEPRRFNISQMR